MIDLDRVYTFEECAKLCGKDEYYFRRRVQNHTIITDAVDPNRPFMKALYGRDLIRHLQSINWGKKLLQQWKIDSVHDDLFIDKDKQRLEEKLKHLIDVRDQRLRSLHITMCKIDEIETQLKEYNKKG